MKRKISILTCLCLTMAMQVFALDVQKTTGTYSGTLLVNGVSQAGIIDLYPGSENSKMTIILTDFNFGGQSLGDIVLVDVPSSTEGKLSLTNYQYYMDGLQMRVNISTLNNETDTSAIFDSELKVSLLIDVPQLAAIPVKFSGTKITQGNYQVRNGGFEGEWEKVWESSKNISAFEPLNWNSFNTGTGNSFLANMAKNTEQLLESSLTRPGSKGAKSALITSRFVLIAKANGNLTTGRMSAGSATPTDKSNFNFTEIDSNDFNCPFIGTPDSISVWAKYRPADGDITNDTNQARISAVIHTDARYQDPEGSNDYSGVKVASATRNYSAIENYEWQRISQAFDYTDIDSLKAAYILVSLTTNKIPGGGKTTKDMRDSLYVDDLEMIYNSDLSTLKIGDLDIMFNQITDSIDLVYCDSCYTVASTNNGKAAKTMIGYNPSSYEMVVLVKGQDFAVNTSNYHQYNIQMKKPQGTSGIGTNYPNSQVEVYSYGKTVIVNTPSALGNTPIYNINGGVVRTVEIRSGINEINNLPKGIYIICNQKIIVK